MPLPAPVISTVRGTRDGTQEAGGGDRTSDMGEDSRQFGFLESR